MTDSEMQQLLDHMDDRKRDELLIRIDERVKRIEQRDGQLDKQCANYRLKIAEDINTKLTAVNEQVEKALAASEGVITWKVKAAAFLTATASLSGWFILIWRTFVR